MPTPKTIEVSEEQFLAGQQVSNFVKTAMGNPKARKLLNEVQKIVDPTVVVPKDYQDEVLEEVNKVKAETQVLADQIKKDKEDREAADRLQKFQASWLSAKNSLASSGYTQEAITEIEKLAQEKGIPDLDVAAAYFDRLHPPAEPVQSGGIGSWDLFQPNTEEKGFVTKMLESHGQDEGALRQEINAALAEVRGQRRAA
jgi:hypothetical protein